jgi:hypothetical protein
MMKTKRTMSCSGWADLKEVDWMSATRVSWMRVRANRMGSMKMRWTRMLRLSRADQPLKIHLRHWRSEAND